MLEQHYASVTGGSPTVGSGVLEQTAQLAKTNETLLARRQALDLEWRDKPMSVSDAYKWKQESDAVDAQMTENAAILNANRGQVSAVQARTRRTNTFGGLLQAELEARGDTDYTPIPAVRSISATESAYAASELHRQSIEELRRIRSELTKSDQQRAAEARRDVRTH